MPAPTTLQWTVTEKSKDFTGTEGVSVNEINGFKNSIMPKYIDGQCIKASVKKLMSIFVRNKVRSGPSKDGRNDGEEDDAELLKR